MPQKTDRARIIHAAAKAALQPLGFRQKGKSRVWFADRGYWKLIVEFTPSSFREGSYLTLGATWLWHPNAAWGFDYVERLGGFARHESNEQFEPKANHLADLAAAKMVELGGKFSSLEQIAAHLLQNASENPWTLYHAAIAARLIEKNAVSRIFFKKLAGQKASVPWHQQLQKTAASLEKNIEDTGGFRSAVEAMISAARKQLKLPVESRYF